MTVMSSCAGQCKLFSNFVAYIIIPLLPANAVF